MPLPSTKQNYAFLQGGGEMGALTRSFNWAETPLGTPYEWPHSLRTTLGIMLHSAFPMFLFWGDDLLCFYNDAYRPSLGTNGKHPALGKPAKEVWPEIWDFIGPLIDQVRATGEPVWYEDQLLPIYRNGHIEDVYWTFSYSPAYGDNGQINGVLVSCTETTQKVINAKQQQETNDLLQAVFNGTAAGVSVLRSIRDNTGTIVDFEYLLVNQVTEQTNNRTDLVGKRCLAVHQQFKQAGLFDDFVTTVETGQRIERDRHYTGEGFDNWYATVIAKQDDGVVFSFIDITAERTAWQQVEESEQRFQAAIRAVQGILWTNNARGEMEGEQHGWEALTGQSYADYQGYGWAKAVHPDDAQASVDAWNEAVQQRRTFVFEHRVRVKAGHWEPFSIRAIPLMNADGSIREWVGVHTNITERIMAQQRIEQSRQQLLALFEQSPVGIAIISEDNLTFRMANSFYGELTGRHPSQLIGKPMLEALPELRGQGFDVLLNEVFATGIPFIAKELAAEIVRNNQLETIYVDFTYQLQRETNQATNKESNLTILVVCVDVTQQVRSRQQVEASEAKLRSIVESAPFPIGVYEGREMRIQLANQSILTAWGKGNDVIGKLYADVLPELANQEIFAQLDGVYMTGVPFHAKNQRVDLVVDTILQPYYFNYSFTPLYDANGQVYGVMNTAADVTALALAKQQIEVSEAKFRNVVAQATVATAVFTGRNMVLELANAAMLKLWDKTSSIIGQTLLEFLPEMADQPFPKLLDTVFTTGETFVAQDAPVLLVREGTPEIVYMDFSYQAMQDQQEAVTGILVMATDVTEKVKIRQTIEAARTDLLQTTQRLGLALDAGRLGSYELELATGLMNCTVQCKANYGQNPEASFNLPDLMRVIVAEDRPVVDQAIAQSVATRTTYHAEYRVIWPDGTLHWIKASGLPTYSVDDQPVLMIGITQDITAQRMVQETLERQVQARTQQLQTYVQDLSRSNQNLQQFAYVASHDLQEPLRKIQAFGDLLKNQYNDQLGEGVEHLNRMQSAASRMSLLIKDLLSFSRISTQQNATTPVSLSEVVQTVLTDLELTINETGAQITIDPLPAVQGDQSQLGQLFQNLLSNALKFRRPGVLPIIRVSSQFLVSTDLPRSVRPTREASAYYCIDISDNGIGFDEKYLDRIFQVFQRLHGRSEFAGTGIGLAICEKVAANHGGAITARSLPGQGATFSVYLPY